MVNGGRGGCGGDDDCSMYESVYVNVYVSVSANVYVSTIMHVYMCICVLL